MQGCAEYGKIPVMLRFIALLALAAAMPGFLAGRTFVHPGITYTQGDLDRMKAMVEAGREPWRSTFQALLSSHWSSLEADVFDRGASIGKEQFNQTIGRDGRRAHDLALIYRLTGDERYAKKAVEFLNANSHYTSTSWDGTAALDNGKVFLLIEAAELMRDYPGWAEEDQARFKRMLTAPGCFYEKLKGFDPMRYGNQALFAERGMIAMGIYLDDDRIYERVIRNLKGEKHRPDDEPFPAGPMEPGWKRQETECMVEYQPSPHRGNVADWGYDDQIQHYIYPNGDEVSNFEVVYLCRRWRGEPKALDGEMEELRFFAPQEIELDWINPPIRRVMRDYLAREQSGR